MFNKVLMVGVSAFKKAREKASSSKQERVPDFSFTGSELAEEIGRELFQTKGISS
jgi:hypothetical protein